jgi:phage regulator Rha-like protein
MEIEKIKNSILEIRGMKVILDFELAKMYQVETKRLKESVRRNIRRFPNDFMFELTKNEWNKVITNCDNLPENIKFSPATPFAFTEQGVAMLSSILKSKKALQVNIAIIRAFVFMRQYALTHEDLTANLKRL